MVKKEKLTKEQKGMRIFQKGGIIKVTDNLYRVPSEVIKGKFYEVIPYMDVCQCENFDRVGEPCKHCFAVRYLRESEIQKIMTDAVGKAVKKITPAVVSEFTP
jgi:hypothetical protein